MLRQPILRITALGPLNCEDAMSRINCFLLSSLSLVLLSALGGCHSSAGNDPPPRQFGPGGGGRGGFNLSTNESVQKELGLTAKQKESLQKISADFRSSMSNLSDEDRQTKMSELRKAMEDKIGAVLNAKQNARLKEIQVQVQGPAALATKDVAEALKLTDDQVSQITKLVDSLQSDIRDTFQVAGQDNFAQARDEVAKLRQEGNDKILAVLNSDQKAGFEKMQGAKFDLPAGGFGGGGFGGGGFGGGGFGGGGFGGGGFGGGGRNRGGNGNGG
jgi:Spy/CpxP family protein refolding chaperone